MKDELTLFGPINVRVFERSWNLVMFMNLVSWLIIALPCTGVVVCLVSDIRLLTSGRQAEAVVTQEFTKERRGKYLKCVAPVTYQVDTVQVNTSLTIPCDSSRAYRVGSKHPVYLLEDSLKVPMLASFDSFILPQLLVFPWGLGMCYLGFYITKRIMTGKEKIDSVRSNGELLITSVTRVQRRGKMSAACNSDYYITSEATHQGDVRTYLFLQSITSRSLPQIGDKIPIKVDRKDPKFFYVAETTWERGAFSA